MKFDIITIFPNLFKDFINESLLARAQKKRLIKFGIHDLRKWTTDNHRTVDDRPYGGGAGMVLKTEPIMKAVKNVTMRPVRQAHGKQVQSSRNKQVQGSRNKMTRVILLSAKGKTFSQKDARRLAKYDQLVFICGRYEGVDERVARYIADEEISIGNYILFGGEIPAMVIIESVSRLIPGVVQKEESVINESFSDKEAKIKEHAQYTRPEAVIIEGKRRPVPRVLLSGDHAKIRSWRKSK